MNCGGEKLRANLSPHTGKRPMPGRGTDMGRVGGCRWGLHTLPAPGAVEVGGAETPAAYCDLLKSAS